MVKEKKDGNRDGSWSGDDITRIIDALMDEDIDPKIKAKMQRWFIAGMDDEKKQEAFIRYADKIEPYTGKLKGDALARYNRLVNVLGLKPASEGSSAKRFGHGTRLSAFWRVAAVVIPAFVIAGAYLLYLSGRQSAHQELKIASADYVQSAILPDSSYISVSPGSTVHYRGSADARGVELSGEAFFRVKRDVVRPFTVSTLNMKVNVLGTVFRVSAFPQDTLGVVSLYHGSVSIETDNATNTMSAGERLTYNSVTHEIKISIIPSSEMISQGYKPRLIFDHATFGEIFEALSAYYDVKIETAPGLTLAKGALTMDLEDESLEASLGLLLRMSREQLTYYIDENGKVIISKTR